jgi:hypothetical protein
LIGDRVGTYASSVKNDKKLSFNTQYMRKSTIIYPVKMECG